MVAPAKGSGIGQVAPVDIVLGGITGGITGQPTFTSNLQSILSGQGTLPNTNPLLPAQESGNIGLSQVPATGLPDVLSSGAVSEIMNPNQGLGQGILDFLMNPQSDTSNAEDQIYGQSPERTREAAMGRIEDFLRGGGLLKPDDQQGNSIIADLISDDATLSATGQSLAGGIDEAVNKGVLSIAGQQTAGGKIREQFPNRSDDFIYGEGSENQGSAFKEGMDGPSPEQLGTVSGADTPAKQATVTALDEYLKSTRPGVSPKDYSEYIKEFSDATGLDVSGEPDNKQALMAFGLALMQNKAGKGFDVGQILSATGAAGEKALPELAAARKEARAIRAKAGEYALGRKKEDQAAAMNREQYYLIPRTKTGGPLGVVEAVTSGKGRFERLNAYELNNLVTNEDFNREYDIVKADAYNDIVKEAIKAPEVKDLYQTGKDYVHLFGDSKDGSSSRLTVQLPDLNNPKARDMKPGVIAGAQDAVQYVQDMERDLAKQKEFFGGIAGLLQQTDVSIPSQARSAIVQGLRNLGFDAGGETDPIKQIQVMLTELKAKNAAKILGESGKTLSDNDRLMVAEIVGGISFKEGDEALLVQKLGRLYDAVVGKAESNLRSAYSTLDNYGIQYSRPSSQPAGMTETGEDSEGRKKYKLD